MIVKYRTNKKKTHKWKTPRIKSQNYKYSSKDAPGNNRAYMTCVFFSSELFSIRMWILLTHNALLFLIVNLMEFY